MGLVFTVFAGLLEFIFVRVGFFVLTGLLMLSVWSMEKYGNISTDWQWLVFILINYVFLILVNFRHVFILGENKISDGEVTLLAVYSLIVSVLTLMFLC